MKETVKEWIRANKKELKYKDVVIYDYDSEKKYIISNSGLYDFNQQKPIKRKNLKNYLNRLKVLMEYDQGGAIFLQVNY